MEKETCGRAGGAVFVVVCPSIPRLRRERLSGSGHRSAHPDKISSHSHAGSFSLTLKGRKIVGCEFALVPQRPKYSWERVCTCASASLDSWKPPHWPASDGGTPEAEEGKLICLMWNN